MQRKDEYLHAREALFDLHHRFEAVAAWHRQIHEHEMRREGRDGPYGVASVVQFTGDLDVRILRQQRAQSDTQQRVVFHDQYASFLIHWLLSHLLGLVRWPGCGCGATCGAPPGGSTARRTTLDLGTNTHSEYFVLPSKARSARLNSDFLIGSSSDRLYTPMITSPGPFTSPHSARPVIGST